MDPEPLLGIRFDPCGKTVIQRLGHRGSIAVWHRCLQHRVEGHPISLPNAVKRDQQRVIAQCQLGGRKRCIGRLSQEIERRRAKDVLIKQQYQLPAVF